MLTRTYKTDNTNRVVLYMKGEYAFKSLYFSNPQQIPAPTTGSDHNSTIRFQSSSPGSVTVDWDDGNVETFQMQNNGSSYIIGWRCLDVDYYKNPSSTGGGWGWGIDQGTGQYISHYQITIIQMEKQEKGTLLLHLLVKMYIILIVKLLLCGVFPFWSYLLCKH